MKSYFSLYTDSIKNLFQIKFFYIFLLLQVAYFIFSENIMSANNQNIYTNFFTYFLISFISAIALIIFFCLTIYHYYKIHFNLKLTIKEFISSLIFHIFKTMIIALLFSMPFIIFKNHMGKGSNSITLLSGIINLLFFLICLSGIASIVLTSSSINSISNSLKLMKTKYIIHFLLFLLITFTPIILLFHFFNENHVIVLIILIYLVILFPLLFIIPVKIVSKYNLNF